MKFHDLLKKGYIIRIEDNRKSAVGGFYDPAEFWMKDGKTLAWCPEVGIFKSSASEKELNANFAEFLTEGLDIIVKHKNDFVKEIRR